MNRTWIACVAGVLCCWSWAGVDAAPFPGGARPGQAGNTGGKPGPSRDEIKARIDTNKDGQISPQELAAAREKLNQLRGGQPGAGPGKLGPGKPGAGKPGGDKSSAGKPGEGPQREQVIAKFDKNGDGKLDEGERAAARAAFEAKNKN